VNALQLDAIACCLAQRRSVTRRRSSSGGSGHWFLRVQHVLNSAHPDRRGLECEQGRDAPRTRCLHSSTRGDDYVLEDPHTRTNPSGRLGKTYAARRDDPDIVFEHPAFHHGRERSWQGAGRS